MDQLKKYRVELKPKQPMTNRPYGSCEIGSLVLGVYGTSLRDACERAEDTFSCILQEPMTTVSAYETLWADDEEDKGAPGDDIDYDG